MFSLFLLNKRLSKLSINMKSTLLSSIESSLSDNNVPTYSSRLSALEDIITDNLSPIKELYVYSLTF